MASRSPSPDLRTPCTSDDEEDGNNIPPTIYVPSNKVTAFVNKVRIAERLTAEVIQARNTLSALEDGSEALHTLQKIRGYIEHIESALNATLNRHTPGLDGYISDLKEMKVEQDKRGSSSLEDSLHDLVDTLIDSSEAGEVCAYGKRKRENEDVCLSSDGTFVEKKKKKKLASEPVSGFSPSDRVVTTVYMGEEVTLRVPKTFVL